MKTIREIVREWERIGRYGPKKTDFQFYLVQCPDMVSGCSDTQIEGNLLPSVSRNMSRHMSGNGHTPKCVLTVVWTQQLECPFGHSASLV